MEQGGCHTEHFDAHLGHRGPWTVWRRTEQRACIGEASCQLAQVLRAEEDPPEALGPWALGANVCFFSLSRSPSRVAGCWEKHRDLGLDSDTAHFSARGKGVCEGETETQKDGLAREREEKQNGHTLLAVENGRETDAPLPKSWGLSGDRVRVSSP